MQNDLGYIDPEQKPLQTINTRSARDCYLCLKVGHRENGVHERIRTSDPRIHTTSTFAAVVKRSWSGLSLHHKRKPLDAAHPVSTPSLETSAWLGIGKLQAQRSVPRI